MKPFKVEVHLEDLDIQYRITKLVYHFTNDTVNERLTSSKHNKSGFLHRIAIRNEILVDYPDLDDIQYKVEENQASYELIRIYDLFFEGSDGK